MKLVPLGDRVVLKQFEAEETTASGIILASKSQEKPQQADFPISSASNRKRKTLRNTAVSLRE